MSHSLLYLIIELNDELIAEHESEKECAAYIADHAMMEMIDHNEGFDWYSIEETVPLKDANADIVIAISDRMNETTARIVELRSYFEKYTDSELAVLEDWRFQHLCNRIGEYAGTSVPIYIVDEYGSYDGITTLSGLNYTTKDMKNIWVATVDAHS